MCDSVCIKHILNGGFIATLAPQLGGPEASALAVAAGIHRDMMLALGYIVTPKQAKGFDGCEQARLLVAWIHDPSKADADKMNEWTAELWAQIADLAAGKLP